MRITRCHAIDGWDVDVLVPGHGPVGGNKELAEMRATSRC